MSRQQHYGEFYRLRPPPPDDNRIPIAVVGNCQAESLRIVLESSGLFRSFRIPPVHEWTAADLPLVHRAVSWADLLISQPVRDDYRQLPCGTQQIRGTTELLTVPVLRFMALNPYIAIVRPIDPPIVPYHDLRIIAELAGLTRHRSPDWSGCLALTIAQLAAREQAHGTVTMSDYLATVPLWHTLNHPDNDTFAELGRRILAKLGLTGSVYPPADRELLGRLRAPVEPAAAALGNPARRPSWVADNTPIAQQVIDHAHRRCYREHPELITAGLTRHAQLLNLLGWES